MLLVAGARVYKILEYATANNAYVLHVVALRVIRSRSPAQFLSASIITTELPRMTIMPILFWSPVVVCGRMTRKDGL